MKRLLIFSFYDKDGIVDQYILFLLRGLKQVVNELIVVINGMLKDEEEKKIVALTNHILKRKNVGYDAGAYADVILNFLGKEELKKWDELVLCNDTFYGPFVPFEHIFNKMNLGKVDFWGLNYVENNITNHIQSYFLVFKKRIIESGLLFDYFYKEININEMDLLNVYASFEIGLFGYLVQLGYKFGTYAVTDNYNIYSCADICLERYELPILKKKSFNGRFLELQQESKILNYIISNTDYNPNFIISNVMRQYGKELSINGVNEVNKDTIVEVEKRIPKSKISGEYLINFLKEKEEIYIYGNGNIARKIWKLYFKYMHTFRGFIVSDDKPVLKNELYGFPIYSYSTLKEGITIVVGLDVKNSIEVRKNIKMGDEALFLW